MVINEAATDHARRMLADVYQHGGSILFKREAVAAGLVHDVKPDKWYCLVPDEYGDYMFFDEVGEDNYAGNVGSVVYNEMPTATLTFPI